MTLDFIGALLSFLVSMLVVALKGQLGPSRSALILERVCLAPFPAADHLYCANESRSALSSWSICWC